VAALLAVAVDGLWRWTRNVVTIVHEAGHAVTAVLTGRRLTGIRLHSDTSGLTLSTGRPSGPGMVATAAAGYLAPSLAGLVGVVLLAFDQVTVMLWAATALLLAMLVMVRNAYGAVSLVVTGAVVVAVSLLARAEVQAGFAYAATWPASGRSGSCGGSGGGGAAAAAPTPTSWPGSPACPAGCGWGSSASARSPPWPRAAGCCSPEHRRQDFRSDQTLNRSQVWSVSLLDRP
jgi:hypothetical protein